MRTPLALMVTAGCAFALSACAGGSKGAASASSRGAQGATPEHERLDADKDTDFGVSTGDDAGGGTARRPGVPEYAAIDRDGDNDVEVTDDDSSHNGLVPHGRSASEPYKRAIATLLRRYYAAALASDGSRGCSLLYSPFAESVPSTYGSGPAGLPYAHGSTCKAVLTNLFKHFHARLAAEAPRLSIRRVLLDEHHGVAVLGFGALPERQIPVVREGRAWRVVALIDQELP
jgi:hypothetical protein